MTDAKHHQIIRNRQGQPEYAIIPYEEYLALLRDEDLSDEDLARRALDEDDGDDMPIAFMQRLIDGEEPLKVYREWRGLSQADLAERLGVSKGYISLVERRKRHLSRPLLARAAEILRVGQAELLD